MSNAPDPLRKPLTRKHLLLLPFAGVFFFCLAGAVDHYWHFANMRPTNVTVLASSLHIDTFPRELDEPARPAYFLRLQLQAPGRLIQTEEFLPHATHPEEAIDELTDWAPRSSHTVYILRGNAAVVRIPGISDSHERTTGNAFLFSAILTLIGGAVLLAHLGDYRFLTIRTTFALFGVASALLSIAFLSARVPAIFAGPNTTAAISKPSVTLPASTTIDPDARQPLDAFLAAPRHILTFSWNGRTVHGGIGGYPGAYNTVAGVCPSTAATCQFQVNPADRWNAEPAPGWNAGFFVPLFLLLTTTAAFLLAARVVPLPPSHS